MPFRTVPERRPAVAGVTRCMRIDRPVNFSKMPCVPTELCRSPSLVTFECVTRMVRDNYRFKVFEAELLADGQSGISMTSKAGPAGARCAGESSRSWRVACHGAEQVGPAGFHGHRRDRSRRQRELAIIALKK